MEYLEAAKNDYSIAAYLGYETNPGVGGIFFSRCLIHFSLKAIEKTKKDLYLASKCIEESDLPPDFYNKILPNIAF